MHRYQPPSYPPEFAERIRAREIQQAQDRLRAAHEEPSPWSAFWGLSIWTVVALILGALWLPLALIALPFLVIHLFAFLLFGWDRLTRPTRLAKLRWTLRHTRNVR